MIYLKSFLLFTFILLLNSFSLSRNELLIKAKMCRICYSRLTKFNISRNKMLNIYDNYIYINDTKTKSACYIFYNKRQIDICFKGTSTFNDICLNLDIYPRIFINNSIRLHNGFLTKYLSMKYEIIKNIDSIVNKNDIKEMSFNGHSSGGAIANIASLDMSYIYNDIKIKCVTFGAPRVGNTHFIETYNKRIKESLRIVNNNDIITYVPLPIIYIHNHKPMIINNTSNTSNNLEWNLIKYLKNVHSITTYINHL